VRLARRIQQALGPGGSIAVAAALFAAVFLLRGLNEDPHDLVSLLYSVPIALLAVQRGTGWGLAAGALALGLFGVWDLTADAHAGVMDYLSRGTAFFALGGTVGALADGLRAVSAQSSRFWELSTDLMCTASLDGYFERLNPAWQRTLGWSSEELRAQPFVAFVHPDDRAGTVAETARLTDPGYETLVFENRYRCKDGSYRDLLWGARSSPERVIYATARDVTEGKRAGQRQRQSERFLDSVLENLPSMVFVKDADELRFVRFNRAGEQLVGLPREQLVGRCDHDLFPRQDADLFVAKDREVLACDDVVDIPEETLTTGSGPRLLHTRKIAIRDDDGTARYLLGISEDITDRRLAERAAEASREDAQRANAAKNEFLSRMSHELRTPLNAVIGFGQLLALDDIGPGQNEAVAEILKAGRHLLDLINEVLDISRIEAGTMSLSLEPVHLGSVLADALSLLGPLADAAQVGLACDPAEADRYVLADQQRLKQVLINLLSNAVKYNRRGGEVRVRCHEPADGRVEVAVSDTGRGMDGDQMARLFEPFDRLGAQGSGIEGTGLGLSLTKGLVQAMDGTISAESEPGRGTTMRVLLIAADGPPAGNGTGAPVVRQGLARERRTIVYVEDNLSNLRLVERLLARLDDVRLIPAMQGQLAIDLARQHQPDVILLDLHLPGLHGREVLAQLKRDPVTAAIPVVVLSADVTPAQFERLRATGAAACLTKPIDAEALLATVRQCAP
jgi:PAS domain S-box-containing protein